MQPVQPDAQNPRYSSWADISGALEGFESPEVTIDDEGDVVNKGWVFRGVKSACYELEPTIEREAWSKSIGWLALERLISSEFKSRARMHLSANSAPDDELSWLALMQHHAVPTRLLDFTYSPFVALYFATGPEKEKKCVRKAEAERCVRVNLENKCGVRLWAIDAEAVNGRFRSVAQQAFAKKRRLEGKRTNGRAGFSREETRTSGDSMTTEIDELRKTIEELLQYPRGCRGELDQGCVCVASPPSLNPRLASQQGAFLLNFAEGLSLKTSLSAMMAPVNDWCKTFDIDASAISEIEQKLFQMNIHEQSLFPDMEGLAGLIRQKLRLHWK